MVWVIQIVLICNFFFDVMLVGSVNWNCWVVIGVFVVNKFVFVGLVMCGVLVGVELGFVGIVVGVLWQYVCFVFWVQRMVVEMMSEVVIVNQWFWLLVNMFLFMNSILVCCV